MKKQLILSPNFSKKNRGKNKIKFIIFHYTGMQSEIESIKRLQNPKSKVSCHYLINRKGQVFQMVYDNKIAWHAGKSKWGKFKNLNFNSIGIELVNRGHQFGYEKFPKLQIDSLIRLCKLLKKKYRIKPCNFLGHSDIAPLRKKDPGEKFPWKKLSKFNLGIWYKNKKIKIEIKGKKLEKVFFQNLYKIGYRYFQINKRNRKDNLIIKAFKQKYYPKKITTKVDLKTLKISQFLANNN